MTVGMCVFVLLVVYFQGRTLEVGLLDQKGEQGYMCDSNRRKHQVNLLEGHSANRVTSTL